MQHQTVKGLVIRETDFGDADRFITVLTVQGARIEVLCRGVRRRGGRLMGAVRLFCLSEMTVYRGRGGKYTLNDASLVQSFWGVTQDMETYALCCYLAELAGLMSEEQAESPVTRLLLYALRAITEQKRPQGLVKAAFELRLMAESGFAPALCFCGACQNPVAQEAYFSVREGVVLDAACRARLGGGDAVRLPEGTYAAMIHILTCEIPRVFAFALGGESAVCLHEVCEKYCLHYTERSFGSLAFYHTLNTPPRGRDRQSGQHRAEE